MRKNEFYPQSGKSCFVFILMIFIIFGALYFASSYHIVNTHAGFKLYPKQHYSFKDTYVDMTSISFFQLRNHKEVVAAMTRSGDLEYVSGGQTLTKAANAGHNVMDAITKFDNEYQLSNSFNEITRIGHEKYQALDERHGISDKIEKSTDFAKEQAGRFNKWLRD